jgi:hypothetical protein
MTAKEQEIGWQTAGLSSEKFALHRPVPTGCYYIPDVQLRRGRLYWSTARRIHEVRPGPGLLEGFVALADAPAEDILTYARKWGVLEICRHNLPVGHKSCVPRRARGAGGGFWEPIESWRQLARAARAVLNIAAQVDRGRKGAPENWETLMGFKEIKRSPLMEFADARHKLAFVLNWLIGAAQIRPFVDAVRSGWGLRYDGWTQMGGLLFANIVMQLMLAVTHTEDIAHCSGCGDAFLPTRRPNPNRRSYCPKCREAGVPLRDAARDYRRRPTKK